MSENVINEAPKNKTLLVLMGPPQLASGKTTFAKEFVKDKHTWIRVNRDDIRLMCGDYWVQSREKLINHYEQTLVEMALKQNYNVIIDATNLNPKTKKKWEEIATKFNATIKYKEFLIPYKEAVKRDKNRSLQVGEDTIRMFYRNYYPAVIAQELDEI